MISEELDKQWKNQKWLDSVIYKIEHTISKHYADGEF